MFKNYDHDENGFISQGEFEKIAASFPFSFCVMDKAKWVSDDMCTQLVCDFRGRGEKKKKGGYLKWWMQQQEAKKILQY